jgi:5-methylcytosine-specific restriction endonuclease McrA
MTGANYTAVAPLCACGGVVTKVFKSGKPGKYCPQCMARQRGLMRPGKREVPCIICGTVVVSGRADRRFCSDSCRYKERDRRSSANGYTRAQYLDVCRAQSQASQGYVCAHCGKEGMRRVSNGNKLRGYSNRYCSLKCRDLAKFGGNRTCADPVKRAANARRAAKLKGATVDRIDPFRVFARDKWRCQLCGRDTPRAKRGTYDHDAPEVDHIIPLSKGGEHSYRNTQCACRKCNQKKSNRPMGQLLLIG